MNMKAVMVILCAFMSLYAVQASSVTTHISANYPSRLELILPEEKEMQMQGVSAGEVATIICQIMVRSNVDWALKVDGEYYGQMQKVTNSKTGIDSKKRLKKAMKFKYTGSDLSPAEKDLSGSAVDYCHGQPGEITVPTQFSQEFSWSDPPAKYRMNVMFKLTPD
jgi:hypothetical protein